MATCIMLKTLRLTIICAILLPVLIVTATVALAFYVLEKEPLVHQNSPVDYETVAAGKALLKRVVQQVKSADDKGITLAITEGELSHLAQLGSHTFARLDTDLYFDGGSINSRVSLRLMPNPVGEYLNLVFQLGQSSEGVGVDRLAIGPLQLPGRWLLPLTAWLADTLLQEQQASLLLASVRGFRIEGDTALFSVLPRRKSGSLQRFHRLLELRLHIWRREHAEQGCIPLNTKPANTGQQQAGLLLL